MMEVYALAAVALLAAGAVVGFVALVSLGIYREEHSHNLKNPTSDPVARVARTASGLRVRISGVTREASLHGPDYLLASQEGITR
jgi:hypothetical protein